MRIRGAVALALLLLPVELSAQRMPRLPRIRGRGATGAAPLSPQPAAIARELAYKRSRLSIESYPLIAYVQSSGTPANAVGSSRSSFGAGTRADYRVTRHMSATLDMTASLPGGTGNTETVEFGTRFRPERTERRFYPFVDLRTGYVWAYDSFAQPFDVADGSGGASYGGRYSHGLGVVGGVGMEVALTRRFSLTTAGSVLHSGMSASSIYGPKPPARDYSITAYRLTLGIRYNPVRMITASATPSR